MNQTLTEQDFRLQADHALEQTQRSLLPLADQEGFEVELQNGVLQVLFEDSSPAKFVVSPNAPVRQIWVSAMSRSYKLTWSPAAARFELEGEPLDALLSRLVRQFLSSQSPAVGGRQAWLPTARCGLPTADCQEAWRRRPVVWR